MFILSLFLCFEGKRCGKFANMTFSLAFAEMKLTISRLIYNFDFEIVNPHQNWYDQQVWGLYDKKPLMLHVVDRKQSN